MSQEEKSIKIGGWEVQPFAIQYNGISIILPYLLQSLLHFITGLMMVNIQKIIMVLHHKVSPVKDGMMRVCVINIYAFLFR